MVEYGYINENGYLTSKILELQRSYYRNSEDEIKERIITVEYQARFLEIQGWKPVDPIDENKMIAEDWYYINLIPFDDGERIAYQYKEIFDKKAVERKIKTLKNRLSSTESEIGDYKVTKCYEASLIGAEMPYDVADLHQKRQDVRSEINRLEEFIASNK